MYFNKRKYLLEFLLLLLAVETHPMKSLPSMNNDVFPQHISFYDHKNNNKCMIEILATILLILTVSFIYACILRPKANLRMIIN